MSILFGAVLWIKEQGMIRELSQTYLGQSAADKADARQQIKQLETEAVDVDLVKAIAADLAKATLVASITLLVSTFSTSLVFNVVVPFMVFVAGMLRGTAVEMWGGHQFLMAVLAVVPDFGLFSIADEINLGNVVPWTHVGEIIVYGLARTLIVVVAAHLIFSRARFRIMRTKLLVAIVLFGTGLILLPMENAVRAQRLRMRYGGARVTFELREAIGQNLAIALLAGMRGVVADFLWLNAHMFWQQKEWLRQYRDMEVVVTLQPQSVLFWYLGQWHIAWNIGYGSLSDPKNRTKAEGIKREHEWHQKARSSLNAGSIISRTSTTCTSRWAGSITKS